MLPATSSLSLASLVIPAGSIAQDTFTDYTVNLTTYEEYPFAGQELHARITHACSNAGAVSVDFDNVRLEVAPIPEPASAATLALLALGAAVPLRRGR